MFVLVGIAIVFGSIIAGYLLEHGNIYVLMQFAEFIIIGGAAAGSLLIMCPPNAVSEILRTIPALLKGKRIDKNEYVNLLSFLYAIFMKARKEGLLGIEKDIEDPEKSPLFQRDLEVLKERHALDFICDNLRIIVLGTPPAELEQMMELEMDTHHQESSITPGIIAKVADSLPGFGIVAAVLGVVITMGKMGEPPEVIGHSVAAALVGTFLGILLCYGLVGPIGSQLEYRANEESKYLEAIKAALNAFASGQQPQIAVETARRVLFSDVKPSFVELEKTVRGGSTADQVNTPADGKQE